MCFCSAVFVPLFLFRWGLFALKPHLPHYLIDNFCSTDLFALALTKFCSAIFVLLFLFCWAFFCSAIFVLLTFLHLHLRIFVPLFLFHYFCSAGAFFALKLKPIFVPLFLFRYFCSAGAFFCSAIFVPLGLFCSAIFVLLGPFFVPLFLFH